MVFGAVAKPSEQGILSEPSRLRLRQTKKTPVAPKAAPCSLDHSAQLHSYPRQGYFLC
jgi:hypothetical protein